MPTTTTDFKVNLPRNRFWTILNDFNSIGKCIPGCEEVQVLGPEESRWKLKLSVGIISRRLEAKVNVIEKSEPSRMTIRIETLDGEITALWKLELSEVSTDSTNVTLVADVTARGSFEWVVNQIIKTQLSKMVNQFVTCISKSTA